MNAQIRRAARKKECPDFGGACVCVFADRIEYGFDSWNYAVRDFSDGTTLAPAKSDTGLTYTLSGGQELALSCAGRGALFNGRRIEERWPTRLSCVLVCGELVFRVHPHDDTLFLTDQAKRPDLFAVIVGFHAFMGFPDT